MDHSATSFRLLFELVSSVSRSFCFFSTSSTSLLYSVRCQVFSILSLVSATFLNSLVYISCSSLLSSIHLQYADNNLNLSLFVLFRQIFSLLSYFVFVSLYFVIYTSSLFINCSVLFIS